jgi:Bacterial Ig domain
MGSPRLRAFVALAVAAPLLAACGGGLWFSYSSDDGDWDDDDPPSVQLAAAATSVQAGGRLEVVAAAADESGIDEVAFYRFDDGDWVRLGSDGDEPYEWSVPVPADGRVSVSVRARATDRAGMQADSTVVTVPVVR